MSVVVAPPLAIASNYEAANFGGSTYMTWRFERRLPSPSPSPESASNYVQVGYACVTKDTLAGMARTAYLYRYAIMANTGTTDNSRDDLRLLPLNGVIVRPTTQGYVAEATAPTPGEAWFENTEQLDQSSAWFKPDLEPDQLGMACVDGGIAAGLKVLERQHGTIQR